MKFGLKNLLVVTTAASALLLAGCGDKSQDMSKIKVGGKKKKEKKKN